MEDASCAIANEDDNRDIMKKCCKSAPVVAYNDDCAIYCLAMGQSVQDLTDCLFDEKIPWQGVWCYGNTTATATATDVPSSTSTSDKTGTKTQSESSSTATETGTEDAPSQANALVASKAGLAISLVVIPALFAGVFF